MRLQEQLEIAPQDRGWKRWFFDPFAMLHSMKFSPALAAILLIVGFTGGAMTAYKVAVNRSASPAVTTTSSSPTEASIAGIREIQQDPNSNKVEIRYDTLQPEKVEGNLNDPRIQQLLLYAARNNGNSGVRLNSIDLLTKKPDDSKIREALEASLLYDTNPGVRFKALEALAPFVKDDVTVRDTILEALKHDTNPGVRMEALQMLQPVKADSHVRLALQVLANNDKDQAVRRQSRAMLATVPEID